MAAAPLMELPTAFCCGWARAVEFHKITRFCIAGLQRNGRVAWGVSMHTVAAMQQRPERADLQTVWDLIKDAHVAVLVTVGTDGSLNSRPMGCVQKKFDGTVWFMTFNDMPKLLEIAEDQRALVSYAQPSKYEFVTLSGRARMVDDRAQVHALWNEGLRVWFPGGPDSPNLTLIAVDVEEARNLDQAGLAADLRLLLSARAAHRIGAAFPPDRRIQEHAPLSGRALRQRPERSAASAAAANSQSPGSTDSSRGR